MAGKCQLHILIPYNFIIQSIVFSVTIKISTVQDRI